MFRITIRRALVLGLALALVSAWLIYKGANTRAAPSEMLATDFCEAPQATAIVRGASIKCEAWDIGTGVTGYVWRAPNARAVVLLQAGWADYAFRYVDGGAHLIPALLERGISVYAFDMWGSGHSPGRRGYTDVEEAIHDNLAARERLRGQSLPVFLVGHSLGGLVSATSVLRDQSNVQGLVLLAPAIKYDVGLPLRLMAQSGAFLMPTLAVPQEPEEQGVLAHDPAFEEQLRRDPLFVNDPLPWITAGGGASISHANWARYDRINIPVLAVHGAADTGTDPTGSSDFIDAIGSDDKTLLLIEDGRHSILDDTRGPEVREDVIAWIEQRIGGARQ